MRKTRNYAKKNSMLEEDYRIAKIREKREIMQKKYNSMLQLRSRKLCFCDFSLFSHCFRNKTNRDGRCRGCKPFVQRR